MPTNRSYALDLLRILATAMVLTVHTGQTAGLDSATCLGANGVLLFFIMSGYLAENGLQKAPGALGYYKRRAARILPLYWLVLAVRWMYDLALDLQAMPLADVLRGPCGLRYLRYPFFLQMVIPSEDWMLWDNRNALWTMSAFAFFYLLAPLLHKLIRSFYASFALLLVCLFGKGFIGIMIEKALAGYPAAANISEFSAKTPLMVLYCFLFGVTLCHALREGGYKPCLYAAFCLLLPALFGFEKCAYEGAFTVLLLAAVRCPAAAFAGWPGWLRRAVAFLSDGSFFLYLAHPMLLGLLPAAGGSWGYFILVFAGVAAVCYLLYGLVVRRFAGLFTRRRQA